MNAQKDPAQTPVKQLTGIGPSISGHLSKLDITTVQDLLLHLPMRYEDRTRAKAIRDVALNESVVVEGTIVDQIPVHRRKRAPGIRCILEDENGDTLNIELLHTTPHLRRLWETDQRVRCYGTINENKQGPCMYHPEHIPLNQSDNQNLTPIYPSTKGLSQMLLRRVMRQALDILQEEIANQSHTTLPAPPKDLELPSDEVYEDITNINFIDSLLYLHLPEAAETTENNRVLLRHRNRLAFEELVAHCLQARIVTEPLRQQPAISIQKPKNGKWEKDFLASLPFELTKAQLSVIEEINQDMESPYAMRRLLQGDTGSGKTVVAAMVALRVIANGSQVALMVPTEVLMKQHYRSFSEWFGPLSIKTAQLYSAQKSDQRKQIIESLASGKTDLVVGTHSLLHEDVRFKKLGLNIIDEQHLFGVHQRLIMQQKTVVHQHESKPHQLIMTATPIPRTFFMIQYSGLSCSYIDEMPSTRAAVQTSLVSEKRREQLIQKVGKECQGGRLGFWICPFIQQSETLSAQSVEEAAATLRKKLPSLRIDVLHSKRTSEEVETTINNMRTGHIDLLVATTIVGVGVDIPQASLMVIDNAERLGLAQLHQLRGRVGRGGLESHCILVYGSSSKQSLERLDVLRQHEKGIDIAQYDLKIRGPGEIMGTPQSGVRQFKVADMQEHAHLIDPVRQYSNWLLENNPKVVKTIMQRWHANDKAYTSV